MITYSLFPVRGFLVLVLLAFISVSYAQVNTNRQDSLKTRKKTGIVVQLDRKNSFIHNNHIGINGILVGVQYKRKHQFAIGFYCLEPWQKPAIKVMQSNSLGTYHESVKFNLYYGSFRYKYTFFEKGIISMGIPFELGFGMGHSKVVLLDSTQLVTAAAHAYFVPAQVGYYLRVKITRWFAVFGSVGYRTLVLEKLFVKPGVPINYSGLYYHYGISIYFKNIIQDTRKRKAH
jgi:hypothetical protein